MLYNLRNHQDAKNYHLNVALHWTKSALETFLNRWYKLPVGLDDLSKIQNHASIYLDHESVCVSPVSETREWEQSI